MFIAINGSTEYATYNFLWKTKGQDSKNVQIMNDCSIKYWCDQCIRYVIWWPLGQLNWHNKMKINQIMLKKKNLINVWCYLGEVIVDAFCPKKNTIR